MKREYKPKGKGKNPKENKNDYWNAGMQKRIPQSRERINLWYLTNG